MPSLQPLLDPNGVRPHDEASATGLHVAIIMDGNGRWAQKRGYPRTAGHIQGAKAVRTVIEAAAQLDIRTLTLYAFSSNNWERPAHEVSALMKLMRQYLLTEASACAKRNIRLNVIGRRDRLSPQFIAAIEEAETISASGTKMLVRVAVDYSSRQSIIEAVRQAANPKFPQDISLLQLLESVTHSVPRSGEVDLLIRTGGEHRLSDFLLWECAYAELYFTDTLWPDFDASALQSAMSSFARRDRRFGKLSTSTPSAA